MKEHTKYKIHCYKIWWVDCEDFYIGSTRVRLSERMSKHRYECRNRKTQCSLFEAMKKNGINTFKYVLLESFEISNFDEQRKYEQYYIDKLKPTLNMIKSYRTLEQKKEYEKEYYKNNKNKWENIDKEEKKKRDKIYYERKSAVINCECGGKTNIKNLHLHEKTQKHLKWREQNN